MRVFAKPQARFPILIVLKESVAGFDGERECTGRTLCLDENWLDPQEDCNLSAEMPIEGGASIAVRLYAVQMSGVFLLRVATLHGVGEAGRKRRAV